MDCGRGRALSLQPTLSAIISRYKSQVSCEWLTICKEQGVEMGKVWQRSFFDRVIRDEQDFQEAWVYIDNNPLKWKLDRFYQQDGDI